MDICTKFYCNQFQFQSAPKYWKNQLTKRGTLPFLEPHPKRRKRKGQIVPSSNFSIWTFAFSLSHSPSLCLSDRKLNTVRVLGWPKQTIWINHLGLQEWLFFHYLNNLSDGKTIVRMIYNKIIVGLVKWRIQWKQIFAFLYQIHIEVKEYHLLNTDIVTVLYHSVMPHGVSEWASALNEWRYFYPSPSF